MIIKLEKGEYKEIKVLSIKGSNIVFPSFVPKNLLELIDILKKLSYDCEAIYIHFINMEMKIAVVGVKDLSGFRILQLHNSPTILPVHERYFAYVKEIVKEERV